MLTCRTILRTYAPSSKCSSKNEARNGSETSASKLGPDDMAYSSDKVGYYASARWTAQEAAHNLNSNYNGD